MSFAFETVPLRRLADRADRAIALSLFVVLCVRMLPHGFPPTHLYPLMVLISEAAVVLFLVARRSTDKISVSPRDWVFGLGGTLGPLLVVDPEIVFLPRVGCVLMLVGFFFSFGGKLNLRRSFGIVPADRGLKSIGLYAVVRHPIYLGYMISHVGFLLAALSAWNAAIYAVTWALLLGRIFLEERFLSENPDYSTYCSKVRYRLVPGVL